MGCQLCIQCGKLRDGVPSCFFGIPTGRNRVDRYDQLVKVFRFDDDPIGGDNAVVVGCSGIGRQRAGAAATIHFRFYPCFKAYKVRGKNLVLRIKSQYVSPP